MTAKTVRSIIEDCYKSREVIDGADKWNELIDDALACIRAVLPSEQEMMLATATVWCLPKHSKKQIDPELSKDMVVAISELMISKLQ